MTDEGRWQKEEENKTRGIKIGESKDIDTRGQGERKLLSVAQIDSSIMLGYARSKAFFTQRNSKKTGLCQTLPSRPTLLEGGGIASSLTRFVPWSEYVLYML